jgi:hypothetical protein
VVFTEEKKKQINHRSHFLSRCDIGALADRILWEKHFEEDVQTFNRRKRSCELTNKVVRAKSETG